MTIVSNKDVWFDWKGELKHKIGTFRLTLWTPTKGQVFGQGRTVELVDGKWRVCVVDELCTCGHKRSEHSPRGIHESLDGHGPCDECDCFKFTWKGWIVKDDGLWDGTLVE
jgi:hypothetical protein